MLETSHDDKAEHFTREVAVVFHFLFLLILRIKLTVECEKGVSFCISLDCIVATQ